MSEHSHYENLNGPERRKGQQELVEHFDEHADSIEARFQRFVKKALIGFAVIGLTSALALIGYGFVLREQGKIVADIQTQRENSLRSLCEDQNKRHDDTSKKLTDAAAKDEAARKTEAGKAEVRRRRDVTLALIDALSPHQDCDELVKQSVKKS